MPRRAASVTQADIARAIRAMRDAGFPPDRLRVRLDRGTVVVEAVETQAGKEHSPTDERRIVVL